jgi:hypothetical protein
VPQDHSISIGNAVSPDIVPAKSMSTLTVTSFGKSGQVGTRFGRCSGTRNNDIHFGYLRREAYVRVEHKPRPTVAV